MKIFVTLLLATGLLATAMGGTVITANLPANTAIVNIDATRDGSAAYNGGQSLWYQPFNSGSTLPQLTLPPGTYQFRVVNPADAAQLYPALTLAQTNQIYTAWTYNSPWIEDYLVFDSAALTNASLSQLFDGAPDPSSFGNATDAYNHAVTTGYNILIRSGPLGRAGTAFTNSYTLTNAATLIFVIPDNGLPDNHGGVSVLVTLMSEPIIATSNLLMNPGAEAGSLTNWVAGGVSNVSIDDGSFDSDINPHTGNFDFSGGNGSFGSLAQVVALVGQQGITAAAIDGGGLVASISFWEQGLNQGTPSDDAFISVAFWDSASNVISTVSAPEADSHDLNWANYVANYQIPAGTRYVQYTMNFVLHAGSDLDSFVDDNSLIIYGSLKATTINVANKYAYAANFGWIDWRGNTDNGAVIGEYVCSGYIYSANFGWINLGSGAPTNGIYYQNLSANDFGINQTGSGTLRGYAYGANIGWINFENNGAPKVDLLTGNLSGYAWSANWGWICLSNAFAHVQTDAIPNGALDTNGLPIAWELQHFGQTGVDPNADSDGDGVNNLQEYLADTDPNSASSKLVISSESFTSGGLHAVVTWQSVASRVYYLQKSLNLNANVWADSGLGLIAATGHSTSGSFNDTNALMRFYRVQAVRPLTP